MIHSPGNLTDFEITSRGCRPPEKSDADCGVNILRKLELLLDREYS